VTYTLRTFLFLHHQTETAADDAVTLRRLSRCKRSRLAYSMCSWVFSEASLHQQILRHQTLTVHCSLARYACRPTQSMATSSLLTANFTHSRPYWRQNFSRLENAADLSSPLTARQRSWLKSCFYY